MDDNRLPSHFIYDIASVINQVFPVETISGLMNLPIEQFFDLATYSILSAGERNKDDTSNYVNNNTKPIPIKNGGWF